jgi:hypothetical protein
MKRLAQNNTTTNTAFAAAGAITATTNHKHKQTITKYVQIYETKSKP